MAGDDQSEISFSALKACCHGNQILLVLVHMGVAGRNRLVAQPSGLTLGFTLHLVNFLYALNVGSGRFAEALISYSQTSVERG